MLAEAMYAAAVLLRHTLRQIYLLTVVLVRLCLFVCIDAVHKAAISILVLVIDLHPDIAASWNRPCSAQQIIDPIGNQESAKEVEIVDISCTNGHGRANCSSKSDNIDEDTGNVRRVCPPTDTEVEVVWSSLECTAKQKGVSYARDSRGNV